MGKISCCPICGSFHITNSDVYPNLKICLSCVNYITPVQSLNDENYYDNKSIEIYNDSKHVRQILVDEEVSKNPLYNPNTTIHNAKQEVSKCQAETLAEIFKPKTAKEEPVFTPKCPICQSPNIKKISDVSRAVHGLAFGLFSKTARSQWVCNNCGNKW